MELHNETLISHATCSARTRTDTGNRLPCYRSDETFAAGVADTSRSFSIAASNRLSLAVTVADSAELDIYVQYNTNGATWTTVLTDSLIATAAGSQEYDLIDSDSNLLPGICFPMRVIVAARVTGCGVTSPNIQAAWHFRP